MLPALNVLDEYQLVYEHKIVNGCLVFINCVETRRPARLVNSLALWIACSYCLRSSVRFTMDIASYLGISYLPTSSGVPNPLQTYDVFVPKSQIPASDLQPVICFVHGGAWRSEDKSVYSDLGRNLVEATGFSVAIPNYRLTTTNNPLEHPGHCEDIAQFLKHIRDWAPEDSSAVFDRNRLILMGHSCSAHMFASLLLDSPYPSLALSPEILQSVQGVIFSEGIYDIDVLLESFPSYHEWFIAAAFGSRSSYADVAVNKYAYPKELLHTRWLIIHSSGDTLVDGKQSQIMFERLTEVGLPAEVARNFDELTGEHNDILKDDAFLSIVMKFIKQ